MPIVSFPRVVSFPRDKATNAQRDTVRSLGNSALIARHARLDGVAGHEVEADLMAWAIDRRGLSFVHDPNFE